MKLNILEKQPTQENPYIVENYPYGFRLRTKIRYWVETTNRGQRFVSQTLNPKTQEWNKPKKSTYDNIVLIGLNEKGHIQYTSIGVYSLEETKKFNEKYSKYFSKYQTKEMKNIVGIEEVLSKVEYKIKVRKFKHKTTGKIVEQVPLFQMCEYEEIDEEGDTINEEEERRKAKETNIAINRLAVMNASKETSFKSAFETFKRS